MHEPSDATIVAKMTLAFLPPVTPSQPTPLLLRESASPYLYILPFKSL